MNSKKNNMRYIPCKVNRFIENYNLVESNSWKTIDLFFMNDTILFPNKPKRIKFTYSKSKNYLHKFKSDSLRLDDSLKKLGICQYDPLLKRISKDIYVFLVNSSLKKAIFKKGQKIGLAQIYLDSVYKYKKKIKVDSSSSFTSKDNSKNENSKDNLSFKENLNDCMDNNNIDFNNSIEKKYFNNSFNEKSCTNKKYKENYLSKKFGESSISNISQNSINEMSDSYSNSDNSFGQNGTENYLINKLDSEIFIEKKKFLN
jgi:hypothetical protein